MIPVLRVMYEVFSEAFPRSFGEHRIMLISFQGTLENKLRKQGNITNFWEQGAWKFRNLLLGNKKTWPIMFSGTWYLLGRPI